MTQSNILFSKSIRKCFYFKLKRKIEYSIVYILGILSEKNNFVNFFYYYYYFFSSGFSIKIKFSKIK